MCVKKKKKEMLTSILSMLHLKVQVVGKRQRAKTMCMWVPVLFTHLSLFFFERATDVGERERYRGGIDGVFELAPFRVCKAALSPSSDLFFF